MTRSRQVPPTVELCPVRAALVVSALSVLVGACGPAAILEVRVDLPAGDGFVQLQTFDEDSAGFADPAPSVLAPVSLGAQPITDAASIVTSDAGVSALGIKLLFCPSAACGEVSGEHWYRVERPFYEGFQTEVRLEVGSVPSEVPAGPMQVGRCEVRGCIEGEPAAGFCVDGPTSPHFCEQVGM